MDEPERIETSGIQNEVATDAYEAPALTEYGAIEEWTRGTRAAIVSVSVVI